MASARRETVHADDGQEFDAHVALPPSGRGPGVLLLQEIFGVEEFMESRAADLAGLGHVVLCPDVFWRLERNVRLGHDEADLARAVGLGQRYRDLDPDRSTADLLSALAALRGLPEVEGPVAVMGYCLGGRLAYDVAVAGDPDACVSYYGTGVAGQLDGAARLTCPTLFHFGGHDARIGRDEVERVEAAFTGRPDVEVHVHAAGGHAFENFLGPMFSPEASATSWPLTVRFLAETLGAGPGRAAAGLQA